MERVSSVLIARSKRGSLLLEAARADAGRKNANIITDTNTSVKIEAPETVRTKRGRCISKALINTANTKNEKPRCREWTTGL